MHLIPGFGPRLREEREGKGLNQGEFGAIGAVSRRTQAAYETDTNSPNVEYLAALDEFGVDVIYLLTGVRGLGDSLSPEEHDAIEMLRGFSETQRSALCTIMRSMIGSGA